MPVEYRRDAVARAVYIDDLPALGDGVYRRNIHLGGACEGAHLAARFACGRSVMPEHLVVRPEAVVEPHLLQRYRAAEPDGAAVYLRVQILRGRSSRFEASDFIARSAEIARQRFDIYVVPHILLPYIFCIAA